MIPFRREFEFEYGQGHQLTDLVARVIARNPGPFTFTGSGTYLVGDSQGIAVIDPGPDDEAHIEAVLAAAPGPISHILVTHTHLDHCGGTSRLKAATGAEVLGHGAHLVEQGVAPPALDEGADFDFRPDTEIGHGHIIALPAARLAAVHTPGHCANHLCYALEEEASLFTGDHIMGWSTTVVAPPDGDMDDYLQSLELLLGRTDRTYYPTHGAPIENPLKFVRAIKAHRHSRDENILRALTSLPASPIEIARIVYTDIDPAMHFAAALNVAAHLDRHVKRGSVTKDQNGGYARA